MKKLITSLCLVVLLGVSANVMGQSSGIAPYVGASHPYNVSLNSGNSYAWSLTVGGLVTAAAPADYTAFKNSTLLVGDAYTVGTSTLDLNTIYITWNSTSAGKTFYLHVIETAGAPSGCTNEVILEIKPVNNFDLAITNVTTAVDKTADAGSETKICWTPNTAPPTSVAPIVYPLNGAGNLIFRINATGLSNNNNWSFTYTIATANATVGVLSGIDEDAGTAIAATSTLGVNTISQTGTITVNGNVSATANDYVLVTVPITSTEFTNGATIAGVSFTINTGTHAAANMKGDLTLVSSGEVSRPDNDAVITGGAAL